MATPTLDNLRKLPIPERIQLVQDLWDSIAEDSGAVPLTDEQRAEVRRRSEAHRLNSQETQPWDEVYERITRSLQSGR